MKQLFFLLLLLATVFSNAQTPGATGGAVSTHSDTLADGTVFTFVEQLPEFPGGDMGVVKFLSQNVQYPQYERDRDIQGKVLVRFIVMEDGSVSDVTVMRGVSPGLDAEAVRVIKMLPKFKPGMQQGKPVKVYYNIPISFKLSGPEPKEKGKKRKGKKP
jgi:protein TonB